MRALESRKQELLAESEVNRIELLKELDTLKAEANHVKRRLRTAGSIASSVAAIAAAASFLRRRQPEVPKTDNHAKGSWMAAALNGAQVGASLYFKLRSYMRQRR
ncbi:MAG TPA: hypothetical protein VGJ73_19225 [Verrucomicrobiae bacterium]